MYCREIIGMCVLGFGIFIGANLLSREIQEVFFINFAVREGYALNTYKI